MSSRQRKIEDAIRAEVRRWGIDDFEFVVGGKHPKVVLHHGDKSAFVVYSGTVYENPVTYQRILANVRQVIQRRLGILMPFEKPTVSKKPAYLKGELMSTMTLPVAGDTPLALVPKDEDKGDVPVISNQNEKTIKVKVGVTMAGELTFSMDPSVLKGMPGAAMIVSGSLKELVLGFSGQLGNKSSLPVKGTDEVLHYRVVRTKVPFSYTLQTVTAKKSVNWLVGTIVGPTLVIKNLPEWFMPDHLAALRSEEPAAKPAASTPPRSMIEDGRHLRDELNTWVKDARSTGIKIRCGVDSDGLITLHITKEVEL